MVGGMVGECGERREGLVIDAMDIDRVDVVLIDTDLSNGEMRLGL